MSGKYDLDRDMTIRRLERQLAERDAKLEELRESIDVCKDAYVFNMKEIAEKEAEIERLRAALERLGSMEAFVMAGTTDPEARARIDYARESLKVWDEEGVTR